jgi:immune inhibitor A
MSTKRLFSLCVTFLCILIAAGDLHAVVASPHTHELAQPDGSVINARQWGDEWLHGWETVEGYAIVKNSAGLWVYADRDSTGRLYPTKVSADSLAPEEFPRFLRPEGEVARKALRNRKESSSKVVSSTGTAKIPILLINFSDTTSTNTATEFESLLFGTTPSIATGPGSMNDYYQEVSYGVFSVSSGPSGVSSWQTAAKGHDYYGQNDASGNDLHPGELVKEAVLAADAAGFDFSQYDNDGDGKVDVVMIVHQGTGEEFGGVGTASDIWSHRWSLTYEGTGSFVVDGVTIDDYTVQPERGVNTIMGIGVFAHEFGHALGLPDLYDTDGSSEGLGDWCLMASGSWNKITNYQDTPAHMSAWCKYFLDWVAPTVVSGTLTNEGIDQAATTADVYQLLSGGKTSGEYFLVENRQKSEFDQGLPGDGLLIWHIDGTVISNNMNSNSVNNSECYPGGPSCATSHYGVVLVPADNLWDLEKYNNQGDTGDPYPGATSNTSFTGSSSPGSNLHSGSASGASVTGISTSNNQMTATLSVDTSVTTSIGSSTTTSTSGNGCPPGYPIDCGNGWCCASTHPVCGTGPDVSLCFQGPCPSEVALDSEVTKLAVLREMRDTRMAGSCEGKSLIDLYYEHAEEISGILLADQGLQMITANVLGEIVEKAAALNDNGEVEINRELVGNILKIAEEISANGGPVLKRAVKKIKREIKKGDLFRQIGVTVTE